MSIAPGSRGHDVAELQQALAERGLLPPDAQPEVNEQLYGPVTRGAVLTFQVKHGLAPDAIVGPRTWAALTSDSDTPDLDIPSLPGLGTATTVTALALELADLEWRAGVREEPMGSNRGPAVDRYITEVAPSILHWKQGDPSPADGWQGPPWCACFVASMVQRAAAQLGQPSPIAGWGALTSSVRWLEAGRARGRVSGAPAPGRIGCILVGSTGHGHVVMVATVDGGGETVVSREGNSGNRVAARRRSVSEFAGFVDLG